MVASTPPGRLEKTRIIAETSAFLEIQEPRPCNCARWRQLQGDMSKEC